MTDEEIFKLAEEYKLKIAGSWRLCSEATSSIVLEYSRALIEQHYWRPIDSAPKDGTSILTIGLDSKKPAETRWLSPGPWVHAVDGRRWQKADGWYWAGWNGAVGGITPTHWMPMPSGELK